MTIPRPPRAMRDRNGKRLHSGDRVRLRDEVIVTLDEITDELATFREGGLASRAFLRELSTLVEKGAEAN